MTTIPSAKLSARRCAVAIVLAASAAVSTSGYGIYDACVIRATNVGGSGELIIPLANGEWNLSTGEWNWTLTEPIEIIDPDTLEPIALLLDGFVRVSQDEPKIEMGLGLVAGFATTTFLIESPQVAFPVIARSTTGPNGVQIARGRSSVSVSLTETEGVGGYALLTSVPTPGTGIFRSWYNDRTRTFSSLLGFAEVYDGATLNVSSTDPQVGFRSITQDVTDISCKVEFALTPGDLAYVNTNWEVRPRPRPGDLNCDGVIDLFDIAGFTQVLVGSPEYDENEPLCDAELADLSADGVVDVFDIGPFVTILTAEMP